MEPPAKRMRIMQSIGVDEVDESNPAYIEGKKQNSEWLKNKFGSIFAKYEAMSDMMSDEWDMREGKVVVDRGHARRWDMEYRKKLGRRDVQDESQLVDDLFVNDPDMDGGDEESDCDARDELAPSQSPEPVARRPVATTTVDAHSRQEPTFPARQQFDVPVPETPASGLQGAMVAAANPAADLVQLVQFPQTPAGQQARKAFELQTAQAVQQAVASILSSLLPNAPALQPHQLSLPQPPATPDLNSVHDAPATAPDLDLMPPPAPAAIEFTANQSSPIATAQSVQRKRRSLAAGVHVKNRRPASAQKDIPLISDECQEVILNEPENSNQALLGELTENGEAQILNSTAEDQVRGRQRKYVFTADDEVYIIESRKLHKKTWKDIANSRSEWQRWPQWVLPDRWSKVLAKKAAKMKFPRSETQATRRTIAPATGKKMQPKRPVQKPGSPSRARHLPTPSSLEQDEVEPPAAPSTLDHIEDTIASGGHFDDDERELLSIYGDTSPQDHQALNNPDEDHTDASQEIPETPLELSQEDSIQQILQGTFTRDNTADLPAPSVESSRVRTPSPKPTAAAVASSTRTPTANHNPTTSTPSTVKSKHMTKSRPIQSPKPKSKARDPVEASVSPTTHTCLLCHQAFPSREELSTHNLEPHPREIRYRPAPPSPATQFDPLATQEDSTTQHIKREPRDSENILDSDFYNDSVVHDNLPSKSQTSPRVQLSHADPPPTTPIHNQQTPRPPNQIAAETQTQTHPLHSTPVHAQSSASKASSVKMSRAEYRAVRAGWAKGKGTPVGAKRKRRSTAFGEVGTRWRDGIGGDVWGKRDAGEGGEGEASADELGL